MLNNIRLLTFDLDGTLVDSSTTIYEAMTTTLEKLNIKYSFTVGDLIPWIGYPFYDIFPEFNIHVDDVETYLSIYKPLYRELTYKSALYPGVMETLEYFKLKGFTIALLTTKSQEQAENVLRYSKIRDYFSSVNGRNPGSELKPSPVPLLHICESVNIPVTQTMMIGDSELDVQCGKNAGATTCAVTYGYRTLEQLTKEKPDFMVDSIKDIKEIFKNEIERG